MNMLGLVGSPVDWAGGIGPVGFVERHIVRLDNC